MVRMCYPLLYVICQVYIVLKEEADTRLLLHASYCSSRGLSKNVIYATDTDVIIRAIAVSSLFENCEIWAMAHH